MQFDFIADWNRPRASQPSFLSIGSRQVPVLFFRNPRARRYILRVRRDGSARVTIPRGGSLAFAMEFARKQAAWIERQLQLHQTEAPQLRPWSDGTEIIFRGDRIALRVRVDREIKLVQFADHVLSLPLEVSDLRPSIENYLWSLAEKDLVPRTLQLAGEHGLAVRRVVVRNQRSRWGSCSPGRTISLNWRLIQAPLFVRDYLILHELMHLREMNHSQRFWRLVQTACPDYAKAEVWLDEHSYLLRR